MRFKIDRKSKYTVCYFLFCISILLILAAELTFYFMLSLAWITAGIVTLIYLCLSLIYLPLYFKSCYIILDHDVIRIYRDIIFKKEIRIRLENILFTQKTVFSVSRRYSICAAKIHMINGSATVYPISETTADKLIEKLGADIK